MLRCACLSRTLRAWAIVGEEWQHQAFKRIKRVAQSKVSGSVCWQILQSGPHSKEICDLNNYGDFTAVESRLHNCGSPLALEQSTHNHNPSNICYHSSLYNPLFHLKKTVHAPYKSHLNIHRVVDWREVASRRKARSPIPLPKVALVASPAI